MTQIKNAPKKIYLQVGAEGQCQDFEELSQVSWCEDKIHDDDIEYTLSSELEVPVAGVTEGYYKYFIERKDTNEWYYVKENYIQGVTAHDFNIEYEHLWTKDPILAKSFNDRETAEFYMKIDSYNFKDITCEITEHEFVVRPKLSVSGNKPLKTEEENKVRILRIALDTILAEANEPIIRVYAKNALDQTEPYFPKPEPNSFCKDHNWFGVPDEKCPICNPSSTPIDTMDKEELLKQAKDNVAKKFRNGGRTWDELHDSFGCNWISESTIDEIFEEYLHLCTT